MVFVCTAMGVLYVEHANVLELCYIELLSGDGSPYSILSAITLVLYVYCSSRFTCLTNCYMCMVWYIFQGHLRSAVTSHKKSPP